ncbi:hypothetical protein DO021_10955 [Desulfobacter hydrogenophilus]|uniref:Uncharacterized protein n=1 Tax=Desulfobacter hydrogenophilus TaxID=2291 RepID=A0A328FB98_9BACT|nr:hypothetical protein [Desulfobacter hydrogenophilus]NDY72032.1 hypothetical protein [Desulfobacter hydrogenophilus]QBH11455.1 hypothetical protein EYB58_00060 [Desulfobacter hydrogenophilus]RAM01954.1 hypothetical protein DO021_10955 [Desulfobacter hydrogenophilus]
MIDKTKLTMPMGVMIITVCLVWLYPGMAALAASVPGALIRIPENENAILIIWICALASRVPPYGFTEQTSL